MDWRMIAGRPRATGTQSASWSVKGHTKRSRVYGTIDFKMSHKLGIKLKLDNYNTTEATCNNALTEPRAGRTSGYGIPYTLQKTCEREHIVVFRSRRIERNTPHRHLYLPRLPSNSLGVKEASSTCTLPSTSHMTYASKKLRNHHDNTERITHSRDQESSQKYLLSYIWQAVRRAFRNRPAAKNSTSRGSD